MTKRNEQFDNDSDPKRIKLDNAGAEKQMISAVTPLFDVPYEDQVRNWFLDHNILSFNNPNFNYCCFKFCLQLDLINYR